MNTSANQVRAAKGWDRDLLDALWREPAADWLRMLLLRDMTLIADEDGEAPVGILAQRFRNFFRKRAESGESDESTLAERPVEWWHDLILRQTVALLGDLVMLDGETLAFRSELWSAWSPGFRKALRNVAETRLIEYFENKGIAG